MALSNPRHELCIILVGIEEIEWFVEEIIPNTRYATRDKRVKTVVVLYLSGTRITLGAVHNQRAVSRHVL